MIVVSIALCKHRLHNVKTIVNDFMSGTLKPDKIHFFVSEEPFLLDNGIKKHELPKLNNPRVEFNYTENIGLIRKFIPIVKMYWDKPETKIIIFDDDRKPQRDTVEVLNKWIEKHPNKAFTLGGYTIPYKPINAWLIHKNEKVHVSATGVGLIVKPKFFQREDIWNWEQYNDDKIDVRISSEVFNTYAFKKNGVPLFCVPCKTCPIQLPTGDKRITGGKNYGKGTKPSKYAQQDKWREILQDKTTEIKKKNTLSVVIQSYNRQDNIPHILKRIRESTIKPDRIIIWNDNDGTGKDLPKYKGIEVINAHNTNYNHNFGAIVACWFCDTDYIALLDDDSLPGKKWFGFCMKHIKPKQIFTGLGFTMRGERYSNRKSTKSSVTKFSLTEVDAAGNTYFFPSDAIKYMFYERPDDWRNICDLHFSFLAKKFGGYKIFVPNVSNEDELPINNPNNLPLSPKDNAMYNTKGHISRRNKYLKWVRKKGIF